MKVAYIVGLSVPVEEFSVRLAELPGAVLAQELPHDRVVVVLESRSGSSALASLTGVTTIREDRPARPHGAEPRRLRGAPP
ncbi:hypothetical protein AB0B89_08570 [Sphaerisporangium sp. NPDC049002]|uniref:hypothetical protein n=1 Tax=unclassified Sphaerisporangium TaxID=2630420 RepID=UPI0034099CFC